MAEVVVSGMVWAKEADLTNSEAIRQAYTYPHPHDPEDVFVTYIEKAGRLGLPSGDKQKLSQLLGKVKVTDKRIVTKFDHPCAFIGYELRDYQAAALDEAFMHLQVNDSFNLSGKPGCVPGTTMFRGRLGWIPIKDWQGEEVLQYNPDGTATYVTPSAYIDRPADTWIDFQANMKRMTVSPEHTMVYLNREGILCYKSAEEVFMRGTHMDILCADGSSYVTFLPREGGYTSRPALPNERKYCFTVPSGMLVLKQDDFIHVTGNSGKSFMLGALLAKLQIKTLIIANQTLLITQLRQELNASLDADIRTLDKDNLELGDINVATSQFISQRPELWDKIKHNIGLLVVDEAHSIASKTTMRILQRAHAKYRIAISATFTRSVDMRTSALHDLIGHKTIELVRKDLLVPQVIGVKMPETFNPPLQKNLYKRAQSKFFTQASIDEKVVALCKNSVQKGRQVLIACDIIAAQERYVELLQAQGIEARVLNSKTSAKARAEILTDFDDEIIKVFSAGMVVNSGLSIPKITTIILVSFPNAEEKITQLIGRALRDFPGKQGAWFIDLQFSYRAASTRKRAYRKLGYPFMQTAWDKLERTF